ncbi:MAG: thioredoxin-like domain-containing protein [Dongiaceae bacterium]
MRATIFFSLILGASLMFSTSRLNAAPIPTAIHRAITQESDWLNVSRPLKPEDLQGRIILLDFWTFCCINCIHVIPDLQYLEHRFGDQLTVIGVHSAKFANEKDAENIRLAILRYGIEHPVVNDANFRIWQSFAVRAWPTLVLINPQGKIEDVYSGEGNRAAIEHAVENLIAKNSRALNKSPLPLDLEKNKMPKTVLNFPGKLIAAEGGLFISDSGHHRILFTNPNGGIEKIIGSGIEGFKDGPADQAQFKSPQGLLLKDGILYVADTGNHALRAVDLKSGQVTTLAGTGERGGYREPNGPAKLTALASPWDLALFPSNDEITIANAGSHQLWTYNIKTKALRIFAGNGRESIDDGIYPSNSLSQPSGLSVFGDQLYFVDSETSSLRVIDKKGKITTLIGSGLFDFGFKDGKQGQALLQHSLGLAAVEDGVYIADSYNHAIRKYDFKTKEVSTILGNGKRGELNEPNAVIISGNELLIADTNNQRLLRYDLASKKAAALNVMPKAAPIALQDPKTLPNLIAASPAAVKGGAEIMLGLPKGWKINDEAPSRLVLFEGNKAVAEYNLAQLKQKKIALPALKDGTYRLQGTLYYCEDRQGALCLIGSIDQLLSVNDKSQESLTIPLLTGAKG